jgi:hypothetical protein
VRFTFSKPLAPVGSPALIERTAALVQVPRCSTCLDAEESQRGHHSGRNREATRDRDPVADRACVVVMAVGSSGNAGVGVLVEAFNGRMVARREEGA